MPGYCEHRASGGAIVTINGKQHYLGKFGTRETSPASWAKYDQLIAGWLVRGRQRPHVLGTSHDFTIVELCAGYWESITPHYQQSKYPTVIKPIIRMFVKMYGEMLAKDFGPLALQAYREHLIKMTRTWPRSKIQRPYCRNYINKNIRVVRAIFRWGVTREMLPMGQYHGLLAVRNLVKGRTDARESDPIQPVPEAHIDAVVAIASKQNAAIIRIMQYTGARCGEVCQMRGIDIDMSRPVWYFRPASHKTAYKGYKREIRIGPKAQEIIRPFLRLNPSETLFRPIEAYVEHVVLGNKSHYGISAKEKLAAMKVILSDKSLKTVAERKRRFYELCNPNGTKNPTTQETTYYNWRRKLLHGHAASQGRVVGTKYLKRFGETYTTGSVSCTIRKLCKRAGIPHWHVHQIRHHAATEFRKTYGLEDTQMLLGHRSVAMTEIYAQADLSHAEKIMAEVG